MFKPIKGFTQAQNDFLKWLYDNQPDMYAVAVDELRAQNLAGMGSWGDAFASIGKSLMEMAPQVLQLKQQRDLMKAQLKQAQQGKPPIDTQQYYVPTVPQPVAIPVTQQPPTGSIPAPKARVNPLMVGGLAVAGLLAVVLLMRR